MVDWRKEIEFVNRANDDQKGNIVSVLDLYLAVQKYYSALSVIDFSHIR